jgi:DNA-directed RNA polymerase subunit beta'
MNRGSYFNDISGKQNFTAITIRLASPAVIRSWSHGEIKKAETINYRTFKPEKDGLFCERIFGPTRDWECYCGKYKRIKNRGIVCDRCGVEVTESRVRRERMGHIELITPVAHIWFVKGTPNRVAYLLGISSRELEKVLYYANYIVIDPGEPSITNLLKMQLLNEEQYRKVYEKYGGAFRAKMGAEAIRDLLTEIDMDVLVDNLRSQLADVKSKQKRRLILRRLSVVETMRKSANQPQWMILECIPVLPPDLRPLVPLDGGRFATSDLNDLYRTVINRNNRLRKLIELRAPGVILRNEKRMLQEAVDALLDNGRRGYVVRGMGNRPLKSLSDSLKGKLGRFRQNLLGKRVDYSGRAVIVVGPELKLHQCGLPKKMALELFKPFVLAKLEERGVVHTIKSAKRLVEQVKPEVWDILEDIIKDHPVLLNRAPTLHRLGIQAFQPVLVEGSSIKIHPLVCVAFNADFDGDQMAVHVPISLESQLEARLLMLSTRNILSPAHGKPLVIPTQDIVIGLYALTKSRKGVPGEGKIFSDSEEAELSYSLGYTDLHAVIKVRLEGKLIETTVGRIIFNSAMPPNEPFVNHTLDRKSIINLIDEAYKVHGMETTVEMLDKIKDLGFRYATQTGLTIGIEDLVIPPMKATLIEETKKRVAEIENLYKTGSISDNERYNMVIDTWTQTTELVEKGMLEKMSTDDQGFNPVYMMSDSGARGSKTQIRQLAGMRGLMDKPKKQFTGGVGEIIETPIIANFREGLTVLEYFISTHGARKGLADTALKTADAGYLTRRLVDVAHDLIVTEEDCGTVMGINVTALKDENDDTIEPLRDRILGRFVLDDVFDPVSKKIIQSNNTLVDEDSAQKIEDAGLTNIRIRSVLTCESRRGVCARCYGRNLATGRKVDVGDSIGVIAAQSIGEPGTQLTLQTFHVGGTASRIVEQSHTISRGPGKVAYSHLRTITKSGKQIVISRNGEMYITDEEGRPLFTYPVPYGTFLAVKEAQKVEKGDLLFEWDPYAEPIITDIPGVIHYQDLIENSTIREELDTSGKIQLVVTESRDRTLQPTITVEKKDKSTVNYAIPNGAMLLIKDGSKVTAGDILVKIPRDISKTRDITGGLPRVAELFEARRPKDPAIISEIAGIVRFMGSKKGKRRLMLVGDNDEREYLIPHGKLLKVHDGDTVRDGQQLCDGSIDPHDILRIKGDKEAQEFLVNEIQAVYRLQGVNINDKHMEVIVRKMFRKVRIEDEGDTEFLPGEEVEKIRWRTENQKVMRKGGHPATAHPILQGITKASISTDSFISAASFQETTRVLTEAALAGKRDDLLGLKENVIMGHLIPAGTGIVIPDNVYLESPEIAVPEEEYEEEPEDLLPIKEAEEEPLPAPAPGQEIHAESSGETE